MKLFFLVFFLGLLLWFVGTCVPVNSKGETSCSGNAALDISLHQAADFIGLSVYWEGVALLSQQKHTDAALFYSLYIKACLIDRIVTSIRS